MTVPLYWTDADVAEQDVLLWELVAAIHDHRSGCDTCQVDWPRCPRVGAAIEVVLDWRHRRMLISRAEFLRSGQELIDFGWRLGFTPDQVRELQAKWRAEEARGELAA